MQKIITALVCWCITISAFAQPNITKAEYYFNTDPGFGKAVNIPVTPGTDIQNVTFAANIGSLPVGVHQLFIRSMNANGTWSVTNNRFFYKAALTGGTGAAANITKAEYFFDTDPGFGKGINIPITAGSDIQNVTFAANINSLSVGIHQLFMRSMDANGKWSVTNNRFFFKSSAGSSGALANVTKAEYFFDTDPGFGKAINIPITAGTDIQNVTFSANINSLSVGIHQLFMRSMDANGKWSVTNNRFFFKSSAGSSGALANVSKAEYYFDTDPGFGKAINIPISAGTDIQDVNFSTDISVLSVGIHHLFIRSMDANGKWSITNTRIFYKPDPSSSNPLPDITYAEYFIDNDPGFGKATTVVWNPGTDISNFMASVNISKLTVGDHYLYIRSKSANGYSVTNAYKFPVAAVATPTIAVNSVSKKTMCAGDSLTLAFDAVGTFNAGNVFNVQLSDKSGNFGSPVNIGSYTGTESAIVKLKLPAHVPEGAGYKIRVSSTNPVVTGVASDAASNLVIHDRPSIQTITGPAEANATFSYTYQVPAATGSSWSWIAPAATITQTNNSAKLLWNTAGQPQTIQIIETSQYGCVGDTSTLNVNVYVLKLDQTTVSSVTPCPDDLLTVTAKATGAYSTGNVFTAQLSDGLGSFASPTAIGSLNATSYGIEKTVTINARLPFPLTNGTGYRVRIVASIPAFTGMDDGQSITIDKPNLGADKTATKCPGFKTDISTLFTTTGLTVSWNTADPTKVDVGVYTLIVTNSNGCKDTAKVTVSDNPKPVKPVISGAINANATYSYPYSVTATTGSTWKWIAPAATITQTANNASLKWNTAGLPDTIQVIETNQYGCLSDTGLLKVNVYDLKIDNVVSSSLQPCPDEIITVSGKATGVYDAGNTFTAQLSNAAGSFASPVNIGSVTANPVGTSQAVSINATLPYPLTNGTGYRVRIVSSTPSVTSNDNGQNIVINKPDIGADKMVNKCQGSLTDISGLFNTTGLTVNWNTATPSTVDAGVYRLIVTNGNGCKDTAFVTVSDYPKPNLGADKTITLSCADGTIDLTTVYDLTGLTATYNTGTPKVAAAGIYQIIVSNSNGCKDSATITVQAASTTPVVTQPSITKTADRECTDASGWTNYYNNNGTPSDFSDDILLLSIKKGSNNIGTLGDGTFTIKVVATVKAGSNTAINMNSPLEPAGNEYYSMNRYWMATPTNQPATPVSVRFYYNTQDFNDLNGSFPGNSLTQDRLVIYKLTDGNPDPTTGWAGGTLNNYYKSAVSSSLTTWTYTDLGNAHHQAEFVVSSFSGGGAGFTMNPLPVSFLSFNAVAKNDKVVLDWSTASESNSKDFKVQRSLDGTSFETIGTIAAAGNSSSLRKYQYEDMQGVSFKGKVVYYRIIETDLDGHTQQTEVRTVKIAGNQNKFTLVYNPVKENALLRYECSEKAKVQIRVIDQLGRIVKMTEQTVLPGMNEIRLSTGNLTKGIYEVELRSAKDRGHVRMMKE